MRVSGKIGEFLEAMGVMKRSLLKHISDRVMNEFVVLSYLEDMHALQKEVTMSDLSLNAGLSKPATSQLVSRLEEEGYLVRYTLKNDRRSVYVKLTDKGGVLCLANAKVCDEFIEKYQSGMGENDLSEFIRLVKKSGQIIEKLTLNVDTTKNSILKGDRNA